MPLLRVQVDSDKQTARRILELYKSGRGHHESRLAALDEVRRRGRLPAGEPIFVGITNGEPARLIYDVEVDLDTDAG
ncbi:hypothetical protein [Prauserella cavernicola]|uniref:Uncharacterized protein n=1 Tax=Prauserella cavernicola TaxID=2800127 RepID=A0A934V4I4_9PSEU|nr:hypothetical protein [Prauserella cavernicola]MBK1783613.1 hypothetical protein [Prauserella cavernicola]